jgi:hypothetical protein
MATGGGKPLVDRIARFGSHAVIWTIVLVPTVIEMSRGWRPLLGDDATITLRSYQVLSLHPPLVGMHSDVVIPHHILYDLGPLQYVLLTVPIHLDHSQGALWGSALIVGLVLSLAVEAMWSLRRPLGCVLVAVAVADLAWTAPSVFSHQLWNADFGLAFLLTTVTLAYAVALGSFGWWPVLVFTASVTVQAQLFYALVAVSLVVVSPLLGGAWHSKGPRRFRWLTSGVVVGVFCWIPTLVQEIFGSFGNLTGVLTARRQASLGLGYGLRSLGGIAWPSPLSFRQYDAVTSYSSLGSQPVAAGIVVLIVITAIAGIAWRHGRKDLAALAWIGLICSVGVVVGFALVPRDIAASLSWLVTMLWLLADLWWLTLIWAITAFARSQRSQRVHTVKHPFVRQSTLCAVVVGLILLLSVWGVWKLPSQSSVNSNESAQVSKAVRTVESTITPRTVTIAFSPTPHLPLSFARPVPYAEYQVGQAILWQLTAAGYRPLMQPFFTDLSGIIYPHDRSSPTVHVIMHGVQVQKVVIGKDASKGQ